MSNSEEDDRSNLTNDRIVFVVSIIEFLELSVRHLAVKCQNVDVDTKVSMPHETPAFMLEASHWDLILCALSSWTQSIEESDFLTLFKANESSKGMDKKDCSSRIKRNQILCRRDYM